MTGAAEPARVPLTVAAVQFEPRPGDRAYNLRRVEHFTRRAATAGVQLLAFPEMCLAGYWHLRRRSPTELRQLAEPLDGPSVAAVSALAVDTGIGIGVGFLEAAGPAGAGGSARADAPFYNSYAVCLPDGQVHRHRKLHAFEHAAIGSGDSFTVFDTPWGVRVGVLICWDNNLVENVRATALLGAEVLLAPHQTGGTSSRSPFGMRPIPMQLWERRSDDPDAIRRALRGPSGREWLMRWLPSRAHDNGLFLVFSNGVGRDDDEVRTGNSMVLDPYGRILVETDTAGDDMVVADCDLGLLPLSSGRRWMAGRRPELYGILTERTGHERDARTARFSADPVDRPGGRSPRPR